MSLPSLLVRPPRSPGELSEHIQGYVEVAQSFSPDLLPEDTASRLLHRLTTLPGYRQEQVRSAYRDGKQLGSLASVSCTAGEKSGDPKGLRV